MAAFIENIQNKFVLFMVPRLATRLPAKVIFPTVKALQYLIALAFGAVVGMTVRLII